MAFFEWEDRFSVGIDAIDDQHRRLISLINRLHDVIEHCNRQATLKSVLGELQTVSAIIGELIDYARYHFSTEEDYMRRYAFPESAAHQTEHRKFIEKIGDYQQRFEQKKTRISLEIAEFLATWWRSHILNSDKKCAAFCCSKGAG